MTKNPDSTKTKSFQIPKASAADLRGRQSVRVSFRLSPKCIEAMNILGAHLRLKPKSLFDYMVQGRETLEAVASEAVIDDAQRVAKTYVISRAAADILDEVAHSSKVPRDVLVETSVQHLLPLIQKEQSRHNSRKALVSRMERHLKSGMKLLNDMVVNLGDSDPMCEKMKHVMAAYERAFSATAKFVKKGEGIEGFDAEG